MHAATYDFHPIHFPPAQEVSYLNPSKGQRRGEELTFLNSGLYKEWVKRPTEDAVLELYIKHLNKRMKRLGEIFEEKLVGKADYFTGIDLEIVRMSAHFTAKFFLLTNPEKFTVDFTEDASVAFTLVYPGNKTAYLELYFEPGVREPVQHVVLISQNKENVFAYSGGFVESLTAFMNEMTPAPIQVLF
ncbi:MAG: hypothetical protein R2830_11500 [Saprospiraceae bacterium]